MDNFGTYFAYDAPASLNIQLQKYLGLEYAEWQFVLGQLFVMYSLPNTFLPFFGGKLTDRFGCRLVLLFCCLATLTGQVMVNIGLFVKEVKLVLLGRFIFGIGGESTAVAQAVLIADCFEGKDLLFATAMNAFTSKMGSIANAFLSPLIDRHFGIEVAILGPTIAYPTPSNLSHLPYEFWIVCTTFILFTGPYYCFNNTALDFLVSKYYPNDTVSAGFAMSVPMTVSTSLLTISGKTLSTSTHSKSIYLVFSFLTITAVHIFLGFTALSPIVPFIALGTAGAINLTLMYPFVNHVIRRHEARAVESMPSSLYSFAIQHPTAFKRNTNTRRSAVSTKRAFKKFQKQAQYNDSSDDESDVEYEIQVFEIPVRGRSQSHQSKHSYSRNSSVSSVSSASDSECDHDDSEDELSDAGSVEYMFAPSVIESFKSHGSSKSRGSFGQGKGVWKKVVDEQESEEETDSESDEDSESDSDVSIDDVSDSDSDSEVDDEEI
ncbi:hypothetical protein HDU79_009165, partial [Rhizoclosmatium sp. JEL0117]